MDIESIASLCFLMSLAASIQVWLTVWGQVRDGLPILPSHGHTPPAPPFWAFVAAAGWAGLTLWDRLQADLRNTPSTPTPQLAGFAVLLGALVFLVLLTLLLGDGTFQWTDLSVAPDGWEKALQQGFRGFLAAIIPTGLLLLALLAFRSPETQHPLLRLLRGDQNWPVLMLLTTSAVVAAPLSEELLFRVILQGWLTHRCGSAVGITLVAVLFAFIHGWRDGLALVPLALILGYIYDRRRDYTAVVATHALFNLANLLLALATARANTTASLWLP